MISKKYKKFTLVNIFFLFISPNTGVLAAFLSKFYRPKHIKLAEPFMKSCNKPFDLIVTILIL